MSFSKIIHFSNNADLDMDININLANPLVILTKYQKTILQKAKNEISKIIINKSLGINHIYFYLFGNHRQSRYQLNDNIFKWSKTNKEIVIQIDRYFDFLYGGSVRPTIHGIITDKL